MVTPIGIDAIEFLNKRFNFCKSLGTPKNNLSLRVKITFANTGYSNKQLGAVN